MNKDPHGVGERAFGEGVKLELALDEEITPEGKMGKDQVAGSVAWALESSRAASNCGSSAGAVPSASAFRSLDVSLLLFQWEYSCLPGRLAWIKDNTRNLACSVFGTCHALPWQLVCIAVDVTQWWPWGARGV